MVSKGNHPQMAEQFRLVKYYNLPRKMVDFPLLYLMTVTIEFVYGGKIEPLVYAYWDDDPQGWPLGC